MIGDSDRDVYYLTDPETEHRIKGHELMNWEEAHRCNARLERLQSRWRWVKAEVVRVLSSEF